MTDVAAEEPAAPSRAQEKAYRPGYEVAAERVLEYIAERKLAPGDRLPTEVELGRALGFSRTVIREAVKVLSALGRVSVRKGSGLYVADEAGLLGAETTSLFMPADLDQLAMLFEFRRTLEAEAARSAATRATPPQIQAMGAAVQRCLDGVERGDREAYDEGDGSFHREIAAASGNLFLNSVLLTVHRLQDQSVVLALHGGTGGSLQEAAQTHAEIFAAIREGRAEDAAAVAERHVDRTWEGYRQAIQRRLFGDAASRPRQ